MPSKSHLRTSNLLKKFPWGACPQSPLILQVSVSQTNASLIPLSPRFREYPQSTPCTILSILHKCALSCFQSVSAQSASKIFSRFTAKRMLFTRSRPISSDRALVGCIMTQHKTSCLAAVLASVCITFYMPGGTNCCTGEPTCMLFV